MCIFLDLRTERFPFFHIWSKALRLVCSVGALTSAQLRLSAINIEIRYLVVSLE